MTNRLEALLKFFEKDPKDSFTIYGIALEYVSLKEFFKAEEYFQKLLVFDPGYVAGYMQYAMLKEKLNDINSAKDLYSRGIKIAKETGDKKSAAEMEEFLNELE